MPRGADSRSADAGSGTPAPSLTLFFERSLSEWASDESTTVAAGDWRDGAVMELVGPTQLLPARYEGCFEGVRELRASGCDHHAHIDLGRVHSIEYVIAPSVCLGFRPSLEVRYLCTGPGGSRTGRAMVRCLLDSLYERDGVSLRAVATWYQRYARDVAEHPDRVRLVLGPEIATAPEGAAFLEALTAASGLILPSWSDAARLLTEGETPGEPPTAPTFRPLLEDAIALRGASLVIFRDRTLVEFKTDDLGGVYESKECDHTSWQIGETDAHHCHLNLSAVTGVEFSAEFVPCQGNRINYTIWFLVPGGCGNPFRSDGYFSFTLNQPYKGREPRWDVIMPVIELYETYREHDWVRADGGFLSALESVPAARG
ncbi:MAG: hypothetical protein AAF726_10025 [Planctomycetota bacterium]